MKNDLSDVLLFIIDQTGKVAKQYSQREFDQAKLGITVDQWVLLKIIAQHEGLSQTDLAQKSLRDPASVTRTLDILAKKGLVRRDPIPNNRRQYQVVLTAAGGRFVQQHKGMVDRHRAKSTEGFSKAELRQLKSMLLRIQKNMQ